MSSREDLPAFAQLAILIPVWQPTSVLSALVTELLPFGFGVMAVIDDGSASIHKAQFQELASLGRVEVLHHAANRGKGRALKTGFKHLLSTHPDLTGVITADADGQHTPKDIVRVATTMLADPSRLVLGCRTFDNAVPLRNRFGNVLTRKIFAFVTGTHLQDTQTGLRGVPYALLPALLSLPGERYEYEMSVLCHVCRAGQRPVELPIATVYLESNRASHFNPLRDAFRIYLVLVRTCLASRRWKSKP